jgi:hypothetical protein
MNNTIFYSLIALLVIASILFWGFMFSDSSNQQDDTHALADQNNITITMYHGEGCMCCVRWADYLEEQGFTVIDEIVEDLHQIKREKGVPAQLSSCHTAIANGYVIEGHVPADDIRRLLAERPDAIGISVPGMPPNAPGMDRPVDREYQTVIFDRNQNMYIYNTHN